MSDQRDRLRRELDEARCALAEAEAERDRLRRERDDEAEGVRMLLCDRAALLRCSAEAEAERDRLLGLLQRAVAAWGKDGRDDQLDLIDEIKEALR